MFILCHHASTLSIANALPHEHISQYVRFSLSQNPSLCHVQIMDGGNATSNSWQSPSDAPNPNPSYAQVPALHDFKRAILDSFLKQKNVG